MSRSDVPRGKSARRYWPFAVAATIAAILVSASPALAASTAPPMIESESVSNISEHDATLNARIDPNGLDTAYKLQIDTTGNFKFDQGDSCVLHPPGIACAQVVIEGEPLPEGLVEPPEGSIPAGYETQHVSVDLASIGTTLQPDTTYHYRAIAANDASVVEGPGQTFTTPPGTQEPLIEGKSVSNITPTDATLEVQIYPGGLETSYEVWLGTVGCIEENFETATCESTKFAGAIPASFSTQTVSVDVAKVWHDLSPSTQYVYSVRASNRAGKAYGNYAFFDTPSARPPSIESESVSHITPTDATLEAEINSEGLGTSYEFFLQPPEPACLEAEPPCMIPQHEPIRLEGGHLLGSFVGQSVSVELNSAEVTLVPGTTYKYWVSATSAAGTTVGQRQSFTTPGEAGVQPLSGPAESKSSSDPQLSRTIQTPPLSSPSASPSHRRRRRHHVRRHRRSNLTAPARSRAVVAFTEEQSGIVFRHTSLSVSRARQAAVKFESCVRRFHLGAALWKRLSAALKQTNVHAVAGNHVPVTPHAEESTWVIVVGHDTVRITASSIPPELRGRLEPLLKTVEEVVSVGKRRMPQSCGSK